MAMKSSHELWEEDESVFDIFLIIETKLQHAITQMRNPESVAILSLIGGAALNPFHHSYMSLLPESSRHSPSIGPKCLLPPQERSRVLETSL
jgi:hypothetical protein